MNDGESFKVKDRIISRILNPLVQPNLSVEPSLFPHGQKEKHRDCVLWQKLNPIFSCLIVVVFVAVPFRFSLLCLFIPNFLFSFFPTLFVSFALHTNFFGVSEFGRCFINFSSTPTWKRNVKRSEVFFKWLEFPFWIFYISTSFACFT